VVREYARRLYDAGLVHGDLSEYNLVVQDGEIVVLDLGQAVTVHHPNAREFLQRDCHNVAAFFTREGHPVTAEETLAYVTGESEDGDGGEGADGDDSDSGVGGDPQADAPGDERDDRSTDDTPDT